MNPRAIFFGSAFAGVALLSLLDAAVKGVVLFLIAITLTLAMRRASAASRHLVWMCAFYGALALLLCAALLPQWRALPDWMRWEEIPQRLARVAPAVFPAMGEMRVVKLEMGTQRASEAARLSPQTEAPAESILSPAEPLRVNAATVLAVWAFGTSLLLSPLLYSLGALRRVERRAIVISEGPLVIACREIARELGLRRRVRLLLGEPDAMPMVWGVFRARLLLPLEAETWSAARLRAVLLHEIAHLRRRDPLSLLIAHLALALHWFNPLAWFSVRQLRAEQERAADDLVLRHGVRASDYAGDLLAVAKAARNIPFATAALTMASPARLEVRIAGILDATRNRRALTRWLAAAAAFLATAIALPLAMLRAVEEKKSDAPNAALVETKEIVPGKVAELELQPVPGTDETAKTRGRLLDRNGLVLAENKDAKTRRYPFGALAAHVLGYPGRDGKEGPLVGRSGAEKVFEARLGKGEDVRLTLDARLQSEVEKILRAADIGRGSVVILDTATGDLLASASVPNFDANSFTPTLSQEEWKTLNDNRASPLLNRPLVASAPGSIYKLVTALAAVRTGKTDRIFQCSGGVGYGSKLLKCWIAAQGGSHGSLNLRDALTKSCNCYFYQLGNEVGIGELEKTARLLGLDALSGLGLPDENPGVVSSPALLQAHGPAGKWSAAHTANAAIGQGYTLATPLQMAGLAATIANGGRALVPRLVADGPPQFRHVFAADGKPEDLALLRTAMRDTVMLDGGTGKPARSALVAIAGKTGTSQMWRTEGGRQVRDNHVWFIGYAPADAPRYAFAISIEGGTSGGGICAPIARRIMEEAVGGLPEPEPQPVSAGHFRKIEKVGF